MDNRVHFVFSAEPTAAPCANGGASNLDQMPSFIGILDTNGGRQRTLFAANNETWTTF